MISKTRIKFIKSLQNKKVRDEEKLFVIEGDKLVKEFLSSGIDIRFLAAKAEFINSLQPDLTGFTGNIEIVSYEELKQISTLKTPHNALAIVTMPDREINLPDILNNLCVALDFVQDPGNM